MFFESRILRPEVLLIPLVTVFFASVLAAPAQGAALSRFGRNLIVVLGSDTADNCAQLLAALDAAGADASNTNRYTVKITAGIVDCGDTAISMRSFVDIEGSGERSTTISSEVEGVFDGSGTVNGADDAELRDLTVENPGGGTSAIAISNNDASPRLTHVTASASGSEANIGVRNVFGANPLMVGVTATGSGGVDATGVLNSDSSPTMIGLDAKASGSSDTACGVFNGASSSPTIRDSVTEGTGPSDSEGIFNETGNSANVVNTQIINGVSGPGFKCVGAYDASFTALGATCL
jgi:hypothetical protein